VESVAEQLFDHSLHNGHPRFWGYITSSAAPIGMLGDFLAASVNPNAGAWHIAPVATEIELETVRWISELLGYPAGGSGVLVSGGNIANIAGFLAARRARADWDLRREGVSGGPAGRRMRVYASSETHTWIQKAADLSGLGTDAIRWIPAGHGQRIDTLDLVRRIEEDRRRGDLPFLVVGNAGTVSTGAVDPLEEMASIAGKHGLWFHVDGAYGAPAALVPGLSRDLEVLGLADSLAVDPHKWLYAPLEAGCILVRDPNALRDAFSFHPPYYHFDPDKTNYFDYGLQNSRGFRALKVWLALRHVGKSGYREMIEEDVRLAREFHRSLDDVDDLEPVTQNLSIATFRYVPTDLRERVEEENVTEYLNKLNQEILTRIEEGGEVFLSNAMVEGRFVLRMCIVNFRTSLEDVMALPEVVVRYGREADRDLRKSWEI
jgi:aromatic-L-amino-acid/L-tryptophan decarboxylase